MKKDEASDPVNVSFFCSDAKVMKARGVSHLIKQLRVLHMKETARWSPQGRGILYR